MNDTSTSVDCGGTANIAFALAEGIGRGFDTFPNLVKRGDFDRLLLRPHSTALQVAGQDLQLMRLGRLLQGLAVLLWAATSLPILWTAVRIGILLFAIFGGVSISQVLRSTIQIGLFWPPR